MLNKNKKFVFIRVHSWFRKPGFTLVELMVVVAIIVLVTALTLPSMNAILGSGKEAQAVNAVKAALVGARAYAISSGSDAAVLATFNTDNGDAVFFILGHSSNDDFGLAPEREPVILPKGMGVTTLNEADNDARAFFICFAPTGELKIRNIKCDPTDSGSGSAFENLGKYHWGKPNAGGSPDDEEESQEALYVLNWSLFAGLSSDSDRQTYLNDNTDQLFINRYTGTVIEPF